MSNGGSLSTYQVHKARRRRGKKSKFDEKYMLKCGLEVFKWIGILVGVPYGVITLLKMLFGSVTIEGSISPSKERL